MENLTHVALAYDAELESPQLIGTAESLDAIKVIAERWAAKGVQGIQIYELKKVEPNDTD